MPITSAPPPDGLGEAGRGAWSLVAEALSNGGALQAHFLPLLGMFAQAVDTAHDAYGALREEDLIRKGRGGGVNPHFRVWKDSVGVAIRLAEQLGASPVALARLGLAQVQGLSLSEELQRKLEQRQKPPGA